MVTVARENKEKKHFSFKTVLLTGNCGFIAEKYLKYSSCISVEYLWICLINNMWGQ